MHSEDVDRHDIIYNTIENDKTSTPPANAKNEHKYGLPRQTRYHGDDSMAGEQGDSSGSSPSTTGKREKWKRFTNLSVLRRSLGRDSESPPPRDHAGQRVTDGSHDAKASHELFELQSASANERLSQPQTFHPFAVNQSGTKRESQDVRDGPQDTNLALRENQLLPSNVANSSASYNSSTTGSQRSTIDPTQLIQMALSLNEGRRRANSEFFPSIGPRIERRVFSGPSSNDSTAVNNLRSSRSTKKRETMFEQSTHAVGDLDRRDNSDKYEISDATWKRTARAKAYFEAAHQYRRLLDCQHKIYQKRLSTNGEGGSEYNSLQFLHRVKSPYKDKTDTMSQLTDNIADIKDYTDAVEEAISSSDAYALPNPNSFDLFKDPVQQLPRSDTSKSLHTSTFDSVWSIHPLTLIEDLVKILSVNTVDSDVTGNPANNETKLGKSVTMLTDEKTDTEFSDTQTSSSVHKRRPERHLRRLLPVHTTESDGRKRLIFHRHRSRSRSTSSSRSSMDEIDIFGESKDGINMPLLVKQMENKLKRFKESSSDFNELNSLRDSRLIRNDTQSLRSQDLSANGASLSGRAKSTGGSVDLSQTRIKQNNDNNKQYDKSAIPPPDELPPQDNIIPEKEDSKMDLLYDKLQSSKLIQTFRSDRKRDSIDSDRSFTTIDRWSTKDPDGTFAISTNLDQDVEKPSRTQTAVSKLRNSRVVYLIKTTAGYTDDEQEKSAKPRTASGDSNEQNRLDGDENQSTNNNNKQVGSASLLPAFQFPQKSIPTSTYSQKLKSMDKIETSPSRRKTDLLRLPGSRRLQSLSVTNSTINGQLEDSRFKTLMSPIRRLRSATNPAPSSNLFINPVKQDNITLMNLDGTRPMEFRVDQKDSTRPAGLRTRQWSIVDGFEHLRSKPLPFVCKITASDINRVKTLLNCTAIKAAELARLQQSLVTSSTCTILSQCPLPKPDSIPTRKRYQVSTELYSNLLTSLLSSCRADLSRYTSTTIPFLREKLVSTRTLTAQTLPTKVQSSSDECDALIGEMTSAQTLMVKSVHDGLDRIIRARTRKRRLLRGLGFAALEWCVLGVMWLVWFVVVLTRIFWAAIKGLGKGMGWLFWV